MAEIIEDDKVFIHKTLCEKPLARKIHDLPRFQKVGKQEIVEIAKSLLAEIEQEVNGPLTVKQWKQISETNPIEFTEKWSYYRSLKKFIKKYTDPPLSQEKPNPKGGNADANTVFQSGTEVSCKN